MGSEAKRSSRSEGKDSGKDSDSDEESFRINWMKMRDATTGKVLWEQRTGWDQDHVDAKVPKAILHCKAVSREINFTSIEQMESFRLEQRILLHGQPFEEWRFAFGFVMPNSTNSWQQVIEAADDVLPPDLLSGNVVIQSNFLDGDTLIKQSHVRIFYV